MQEQSACAERPDGEPRRKAGATNSVSEAGSSAAAMGVGGEGARGAGSLQLVRIPVEKPQAAVAFLHARSQGVMDLIAHFWERLPQTPPLQRGDLHLVVAGSDELNGSSANISELDHSKMTGAMLYVPKAHRADVLATDAATAGAFAAYISHRGAAAMKSDNAATTGVQPAAGGTPQAGGNGTVGGVSSGTNGGGTSGGTGAGTGAGGGSAGTLPLVDLSGGARGAAAAELPGDAAVGTANGRVPIDFLTGHADGIGWMVPALLPLVHKKAPARQLVNVVMQLPPEVPCEGDGNVRVAKESDVPVLNRWRRLYKEERGILFDADLDAWVQTGRVFVYEHDRQIVAVAKFDLELQRLIEIGGVYTFPEFRKQGFGGKIVADLACRVRGMGKVPTLQVDVANEPALKLYEGAGWRPMGRLARVWLTG